jgi:hypothetical protein
VSKHVDAIMSYQNFQIGEKHLPPQDVSEYFDAVMELKVLFGKCVVEKMQRERESSFILPASLPMRCIFESGQGKLSLRSKLPKYDYVL